MGNTLKKTPTFKEQSWVAIRGTIGAIVCQEDLELLLFKYTNGNEFHRIFVVVTELHYRIRAHTRVMQITSVNIDTRIPIAFVIAS